MNDTRAEEVAVLREENRLLREEKQRILLDRYRSMPTRSSKAALELVLDLTDTPDEEGDADRAPLLLAEAEQLRLRVLHSCQDLITAMTAVVDTLAAPADLGEMTDAREAILEAVDSE